jgi:hypothetical protein
LLRRICTSNPFYVLSAGLFLIGLRISFGPNAEEIQTWALLSSLAAYTLLLAGAALLLVRCGNVWDDVRTVLLLVVLMFLATSVTFDEVLILHPWSGILCYLVGLLFAVVVSEVLLRGTGLKLPAAFRVPYYLILGLFFLYPPLLSPFTRQPHSEALLWGLFGFSTAAGLVFLTLLPAIRRGPSYVRDNGSPWLWPLYPWVLFGLLAAAVPARAFLLCWSMHLLRELNQLLFGPYFLVPFGLCLAVLLLEVGAVSKNRVVSAVALAFPLGLVGLTLVGHRSDPIYREFMNVFISRLGADPLYATLCASVGFYSYAALRRDAWAVEGLTAALTALAFIGPDALSRGALGPAHAAPLLAAALLQLTLGLLRRNAWRCLLGACGLAAAALVVAPPSAAASPWLKPVAFHLALLLVMVVGAAFNDARGRLLRVASAVLVLLACRNVLLTEFDRPPLVPDWMISVYPLAMALILAAYGRLLSNWFCLGVAAFVAAAWFAVAGWQGYSALRQTVSGLDHIAVSLILLLVAIAISLGKAGVYARWFGGWRVQIAVLDETVATPQAAEPGQSPEGEGPST